MSFSLSYFSRRNPRNLKYCTLTITVYYCISQVSVISNIANCGNIDVRKKETISVSGLPILFYSFGHMQLILTHFLMGLMSFNILNTLSFCTFSCVFLKMKYISLYLFYHRMAAGNAHIGKPAPDFTAKAVMPDGQFKDLSLSDYRGMT